MLNVRHLFGLRCGRNNEIMNENPRVKLSANTIPHNFCLIALKEVEKFKKAHANTRVLGLFGALRLATHVKTLQFIYYIYSVTDYGLCQLNSRSQAANGRFARWKKLFYFLCFFFVVAFFSAEH